MYRFQYDKHHRYVKSTPQYDTDGNIKNIDRRYEQKGLREQLLCDKCEKYFAVSEGYAREVFNLKRGTHEPISDAAGEISGLDYSQMRTFLLSILWRMSVSSINEFAVFQLSVDSEMEIAEALRSRDVSKVVGFEAAVSVVFPDDGSVTPMVGPMQRSFENGSQTCALLAHALLLNYLVKGNEPLIERDAIKPDGRMMLRFFSFESLFPNLLCRINPD